MIEPTKSPAEIITHLSAQIERMSGKLDDLAAILGKDPTINQAPMIAPTMDGLLRTLQKAQCRLDSSLLRPYALLLGQMALHMESPASYTASTHTNEQLSVAGVGLHPVAHIITAHTSVALAVMEAAIDLRLSFTGWDGVINYSSGAALFPNLKHRIHLAAVLAKCGRHYDVADRTIKRNAYPKSGYCELDTKRWDALIAAHMKALAT